MKKKYTPTRMHTQDTTPVKKQLMKRAAISALVILAVLLIGYVLSSVGAADISTSEKVAQVTTAQQSVKSEPADTRTQTEQITSAIWNRLERRLTSFTPAKPAAAAQKTATQRSGLGNRLAALILGAGKPTEGQVLMFTNGRYTWQSLSVTGQAPELTNATAHVSGYGRRPFPINAGQVLRSAAGGTQPTVERHYAGGGRGGGGATATSGGSTTNVTNVTNNYTTVGGGATFIGLSTATNYTGLFSYSGSSGYAAANAICTAAFAGSHMCTADEILQTVATKNITTLFSGVADAWIAQGPPGFTADSNDCRGWTSANTAHLGAWWDFDAATGGIGYLTSCATTKPIACCKVQ